LVVDYRHYVEYVLEPGNSWLGRDRVSLSEQSTIDENATVYFLTLKLLNCS